MSNIKSLFMGQLLFLATACSASAAPPASADRASAALALSPALLDLFRAEMRELLVGTQAIASALPAGDWDGIVATSRQMKASYVLEKKLTPAQEKELAALPGRFKELDQGFHARAGRLADAAIKRDYEAVAFHYSRLLETCAACHASFAPARFPTFGTPPAPDHHH